MFISHDRSSHTCTYGMEEGRLQHSECKEIHAFKPFSSGDKGAITEQIQTLTLRGTGISSITYCIA